MCCDVTERSGQYGIIGHEKGKMEDLSNKTMAKTGLSGSEMIQSGMVEFCY